MVLGARCSVGMSMEGPGSCGLRFGILCPRIAESRKTLQLENMRAEVLRAVAVIYVKPNKKQRNCCGT